MALALVTDTPLHAPSPRDQADGQLAERLAADGFSLLHRIGRGGMATVWLGRDRALERYVAIKVLAPELTRDAHDRGRFRREARVLAAVAHPGVVPVFAFRDGRPAYLVMGHVAGETLAERLRREPVPPAAFTQGVLAALADALAAVHAAGVVHRDVKPGNVILDARHGRPVLVDFGVATERTSEVARAETRHAFGTADYMAPEQILGEPDADGRIDVYALGVIGWQMLAGRHPFAGGTREAMAARHVSIAPPALAAAAPGAPRALVGIVERCLAKDPADRWRTAGELAAALTAAAQPRRRWWWRR